jgi:hypothetical protein
VPTASFGGLTSGQRWHSPFPFPVKVWMAGGTATVKLYGAHPRSAEFDTGENDLHGLVLEPGESMIVTRTSAAANTRMMFAHA